MRTRQVDLAVDRRADHGRHALSAHEGMPVLDLQQVEKPVHDGEDVALPCVRVDRAVGKGRDVRHQRAAGGHDHHDRAALQVLGADGLDVAVSLKGDEFDAVHGHVSRFAEDEGLVESAGGLGGGGVAGGTVGVGQVAVSRVGWVD